MLEELRRELKELDERWSEKLRELWRCIDIETEDKIRTELNSIIRRRIKVRREIYRIEEED